MGGIEGSYIIWVVSNREVEGIKGFDCSKNMEY